MMAALQHFATAMTWCNEPVQLCICPHNSAGKVLHCYYKNHPSGALALAQGEEVET